MKWQHVPKKSKKKARNLPVSSSKVKKAGLLDPVWPRGVNIYIFLNGNININININIFIIEYFFAKIEVKNLSTQ